MLSRRRARRVSPDVRRAVEAVGLTLRMVEEAKATLLLGVPSGRSPRLPLAEALLGFEQGLQAARVHMPEWRVPGLEAEWRACSAALEQVADGAERLRLGPSSEAYEELVPTLDALLDPLETFAAAAARLREL